MSRGLASLHLEDNSELGLEDEVDAWIDYDDPFSGDPVAPKAPEVPKAKKKVH